MKIIEQSHTWIKEPDPIKLIEFAGRTCYKSEDKITEDSANKFVKMLIKSGHMSVLEHGQAAFEVESYMFDHIGRTPHSQFIRRSQVRGRTIISANFRAWEEFFEAYYSLYENKALHPIQALNQDLYSRYPDAFMRLWYSNPTDSFFHRITENQMTSEEKLIHATRTCRFGTNRGVTHELVRHRSQWAFSQESTRYVKYDGEMEFILPVWVSKNALNTWDYIGDIEGSHAAGVISFAEQFMLKSQLHAELTYKKLLLEGWKPEQAREVLPNSLKTEIVCTAPLSEWRHMLRLRTSKAAHPQMRALMEPVLSDLKEELPDLF